MGGLENRLIDELEPITVRSTAELTLKPLHRGHLAVVNKLRDLIVAENGFLEVRQAGLGCLRCAGNRVEITEITGQVLGITSASLNGGGRGPAQVSAPDKIKTTPLHGGVIP